MSVKYAYLKPTQGNSPFYVHITVDEQTRSVRIYWHMAWWKGETVDPKLFADWTATFRRLYRGIERAKEKEKRNSYSVQGRCDLSRNIFRDLIGFYEKDTSPKIQSKIKCYVNSVNKIIEVEINMNIKPLGSLAAELLKLPVFTTNPNLESVRPRLVFFRDQHVLIPGSEPAGPAEHVSYPPHSDSPVITATTSDVAPELTPPLDLEDDHHGTTTVAENAARQDPKDDYIADTIDTSAGHPYGSRDTMLPPLDEGDEVEDTPNS